MRRWVLLVLLMALTGCADPRSTSPSAAAGDTASASPTGETQTPTASPSPTATPAPGTVPPPWLGTRVLPRDAAGFGEVRRTPRVLRQRRFTLPDTVAALPGRGFAARVRPVPPRVLRRSTWTPDCPVAAADLRWVRVTFRGFDRRRHTGELLLHRDVTAGVVRAFRDLWRARFPLERLVISRPRDLTAPPTGDGNDSGSYACRPVRGARQLSQHAYGRAIDLNPFQNPYLNGDQVLPELASAYLDRGRHRPGMIQPGGPVVRAFARIGWEWGGNWRDLKDYQHFSANGH